MRLTIYNGVMDFSYILKTHEIDKKKLKKYGFSAKNDVFLLNFPIENGEFVAQISLTDSEFKVDLFDVNFGEMYENINLKDFDGTFVNSLRQQISQKIEDVCQKCFINTNTREIVIETIKNNYGVLPEFPWAEYPTFCTFKNPSSKKWFALIMDVGADRLGLKDKTLVSVINLKLPPEEILSLTDNKFIFPAYHMNKKYWVTVLLNKATPKQKLFSLIDKSYNIVAKK